MLLGRYAFRAMGSPCELHLYGVSRAAIDAVADAARALVERLEQKYSRYREDSVLSAINRSAGDPAGVVVDDETALLLDYAATAHAESGGLFDATSGSLRRVWDLRSGRVPEQAEITAQLERVGWHRVRWERPRFAMPVAGMELDFGGFVKEYAVDLVADLCRAHGVHNGMVDLGGDLHAIGPHPSGKPWITGIRDPEHPERAIASVGLMRAALATSGDYERCMVVDGVRYTHILDPHTVTFSASTVDEKIAYARHKWDPNDPDFSDTSSNANDSIRHTRMKVSYVYRAKYGASFAYFTTSGTNNPLVYDPNGLGLAGNPGSRVLVPEIFWTPIQYVRVGAQLWRYQQLMGASANYAGDGRNASDNNTLFLYVWAAY
jgi:thiamine biosynthesis lipoprotein